MMFLTFKSMLQKVNEHTDCSKKDLFKLILWVYLSAASATLFFSYLLSEAMGERFIITIMILIISFYLAYRYIESAIKSAEMYAQAKKLRPAYYSMIVVFVTSSFTLNILL